MKKWNLISLLTALSALWLIINQVAFLGLVPGFHFDEAWAANHAYRIAFEAGFWPMTAMSPYTASWTHYWAALFFKFFGVSVFTFRLSQVSLALGGVALMWGAMVKINKKRSAAFFLLMVTGSLALNLNQRFAIELTGFHVLCLGIVCWAVSSRQYWALVSAVFLGVTAHLMFLCVPLGLLTARLWDHPELTRAERAWVAACTIVVIPFFVSVLFGVPEKDKAFALLLGSIVVLLWAILSGRIWESAWRWIRRWVLIFSIPFFLMLLFFLEGHWSVALVTGRIPTLWSELAFCVAGLGFVLLLFGLSVNILFWQARRSGSDGNYLKRVGVFLMGTVFFTGVLMLKPTPRYFELSILLLMGFVALAFEKAWERWPARSMAIALGWATFGSLVFYFHVARPSLYHRVVDRELRFLIFKDRSTDFISPEGVIKDIALRGCSGSIVFSGDGRVSEALGFYQKADAGKSQPPESRCPWERIRLDRASAFDKSLQGLSPPGDVHRGGEWVWVGLTRP